MADRLLTAGGQETLLKAPAYHVEELADGSVLIVAVENPMDRHGSEKSQYKNIGNLYRDRYIFRVMMVAGQDGTMKVLPPFTAADIVATESGASGAAGAVTSCAFGRSTVILVGVIPWRS